MRPDLFADLEFPTALHRATAERKLLLVDATAAWCGPCQMMDRTTWLDAEVIAWLGEHAIAIQVDVDAQKEVARELRIQAMPTIIAFVEGKEFDRVVGAKKPKELLAWLEGVTRGETSLVAVERSARDEPANMLARLDLARELARAGRHDEALVEHVWLWEHMLEYDPALYGVRRSFFARDLEMLAKAHAPARAAIQELRDRAAPADAGSIDRATFVDWMCLNRVLGEHERTLVWYDAMPAEKRPSLAPLLELHIIPLLVEAERWAEAGALYEDPLATINRSVDIVMGTPEHPIPEEMIEYGRVHLRKQAAELVRALFAAHRLQDAESVAMRAREIDPSDEMLRSLAAARSASLRGAAKRHSAWRVAARKRKPTRSK